MAQKMTPKQWFRDHLKFSFGFGFRAFKKFPELIPLVTIVTTALTGAVGFIVYALNTKPDVRIVRSKGPPHEDVRPTESRKIYDHNPEIYRPIRELEDLKDDLKVGDEKY